jgi:RimJ/RimL family protein N-acetyltransferase
MQRQFDIPPALSGPLVLLEPLTERHVTKEYLRWLADPEVTRYLDVRFQQPQTEQAILDYVNSFYGQVERYAWAICLRETRTMVGTATIPRVDRIHLTAGIGLMIGDQRAWGTGAGPQALELIVEFAFESLRLRRLAEHNVAINHRSNFMLRRAGFRHEGTLRSAYRLSMDRDEWVDGLEFGLLADEWRARKLRSKS